jgi:CzcA family heavy metal efflux pump
MNISGFAQHHPKAIVFIIAVLVLAGIITAFNLPVSIFPEIDFPRIVILADNGEEPADRVMATLTKPLEEAANSIPGVRNVRSITARGSAEISINFDWGTDIILAQQLLQAKISSIRNQLPATADVQVERMNATFFPIIGYALTSNSQSLVDLRDIAFYTIRPALSRIRGISQVRVVGGRTREFLVIVNPARLAAYNLDIRQISDALQNTNIVSSVGLMDANYHLYLTLVDNMFISVDDIGKAVIGTRGNTPIFLRDVALVTPSEMDEYIKVISAGKEAVLINIIKQPNGNTVQIASDVKSALSDLSASKKFIPADVKIENFYDQSDLVNESFTSVRDSIGIGILLSIIVLFAFLRNWRITFAAAVIIPVTVAITICLLFIFKQSLNIMTLGGIAAAIGLIIDDTIVIIENIFQHFKKGHERVSSAIQGAVKEMLPAVFGSSTSTIVIFIPFAFLGGVTGAFFKSLSLTIALALLVSLILSLLLAPILASKLIRGIDFEREAKSEQTGKVAAHYKSALALLLKRRFLIIPIVLFLLGGSFWLYHQLGSGFMPDMDEGSFILDYASPPGTSLNETNRMLLQVEKIIMSIPEVEAYSRQTGTQMGFFITEPNSGDYVIKLRRHRNRSSSQIMDELRIRIETTQPALRIEFGQPIQDLIGDLTSVPSPIEIKVFGENSSLTKEKAQEIAHLISSVPGVVDVFDGITISGPAYVIKMDEQAIGRAGLTVEDVRQELQNDIQGSIATEVQHGEKLIGIHVRLPNDYRKNLDQLHSIRIYSPNGGIHLLGSLATITVDPGQSEIDRENLKQMVAVTARISSRDLGSTIADIQSTLKKNLVLPQGISLQYGGTYETQQKSFIGLLMVLLAASLLVFIVLVIEFESYFVPVAIYAVTILSLFGVFLSLWMTNVNFNISSFMGAIMIVGIVAENSIFLVHYVRHFHRAGKPLHVALVEAGGVRFRPIIMTALAAILALLPLAIGIGAGAQMQQPLAIAVIGGFSMSSILLLFILPVMLSIGRKIKG